MAENRDKPFLDEVDDSENLLTQEELKLSDQEEQEVEQRGRPRAAIIYEAVRIEGEREIRRSVSGLSWSGLAAGLSMGFSLVGIGLLHASLPDAPWRPLISKLGYSIGFIIVILGRQQLFTENTLTAILPLLAHCTRTNLIRVLRLWAVVLSTNLVGAWTFVQIIGHTEVFSPEIRQAFTEIGLEAMGGGFWTTFSRAVFAGWLIALMTWLLPGAETSRLAIIVVITYMIGLAGFAHIIAGSAEVLYLVTTGSASWGAYLGGFMLPTLLGNIVGGVSLVAVFNYAQVLPETRQQE